MGIDSNYSPDMLEDLLPLYYKKAFPHNLFVRWLCYGRPSKNYFAYREFTFTLKDDVYVRYQSFNDQAEFEKEMLRILPHKIDIGAVYTHRPREHKTINSMAFQAVERELIFDIDMTDYDDVSVTSEYSFDLKFIECVFFLSSSFVPKDVTCTIIYCFVFYIVTLLGIFVNVIYSCTCISIILY